MKGVGSAPPNSLTTTQAAKARDVERVATPVVEDWVEKGAVDVDRARLVTGTRNEQPLVDVRTVVTGRAGETEIARRASEDLRAVEQHVAVGHERQIGLVNALFLEIENKPRQRILVEYVGAGRQAWRHLDGATAEYRSFRQGAQCLARSKIGNEVVLRNVTGDDPARGCHRVAVSGCDARAQDPCGTRTAVQLQPGKADLPRNIRLGGGDTVRKRAIEFPSCPHGLLRMRRVFGRNSPVQFLFDPERYEPRRLCKDRLPVFMRDRVQKLGSVNVAFAIQPRQGTDGEFRTPVGFPPGGLNIIPGQRLEISKKERQPVGPRLGKPGGLLSRCCGRRSGQDEHTGQRGEQHSQEISYHHNLQRQKLDMANLSTLSKQVVNPAVSLQSPKYDKAAITWA